MTPKDLRAHKLLPKQLRSSPEFKLQKRGKLPKPFNRLGGSRIYTTGMLDVSDNHVVLMCWKDGEIQTDSAFFGYLHYRLANGDLSPLFEFHWHPSHKGFHCKTPCKTEINHTNRFLTMAREIKMQTKNLDPRIHEDRLELILIFCDACGISPPDNNPTTESLFYGDKSRH